MDRQTLLVGLVIITLIVNVMLGVELYYTLHNRPTQPVGGIPINVSTVQIISPSSSTTTNTTSGATSTITTTQSSTTNSGSSTTKQPQTYSFSFKAEFKIHVKEHGIYIVGIKPNTSFSQLYVILYFEDGQVVTLNLNQTYANVTIKEDDVKVTAYIYGKSYENLTPQQILNDIGLYFKFIGNSTNSSSNENSEEFILVRDINPIKKLSEIQTVS
ncbi:putative membrane-anchored protein [Saccharolobus shibatae]|uniref:Putative membrane-anchored protein n=1 Tax=Saccharolobus shibatae TaxID=2286 RepID=A0A8F5BT51_9CREN|nr:putative membrane-anchored protein [Saccharolobus shibatae]